MQTEPSPLARCRQQNRNWKALPQPLTTESSYGDYQMEVKWSAGGSKYSLCSSAEYQGREMDMVFAIWENIWRKNRVGMDCTGL